MVATAVIAIAATSVAMGAVVSRHKTIIPTSSAGSATAQCKRGMKPVAGGFAAPGFNPTLNNGPVFRFASMPAGKRGIKTAAFNFSDNPGELDSYAYCAKRAHVLRIKSNGSGSFQAAMAPWLPDAPTEGRRWVAASGRLASP